MTRTLLRTALTMDQVGRSAKLDYYLLAEDAAGLEQYGVEVVMQRGKLDERCTVAYITPLASCMIRIIGILAEATVTPTTVREILEDIL